MKAVLVWPPQEDLVASPYMKDVQEGLGLLPPMGIISVATWAAKFTEHHVTVLDACTENLTMEQTATRVVTSGVDVVGLSCMTHTWHACLSLARKIKELRPDIIVVLGGPHCTLYAGESLEQTAIDYVVNGEGEAPFAALLDRLAGGRRDTLDLDGVMRRGDPLKPRYLHANLDEIPLADRRLTNWQLYKTVVSKNPPTTTLISSRGCPYSCAFCYTAGGKKYRCFSPERIVAELESCVELGISEFLFFDELFTMDRTRVVEFCRIVREKGLKVSWDVRARVNLVDAELLRLMAEAGCRRIQFGVEAGTERILKVLQKGISLEQARQAVEWARRAGIATYADFMLGAPGETREEMRATVEFARNLNLDYVHFSVLMLLPQTKFYREALSRGLLSSDVWREYVLHPYSGFVPPYWTESYSPEELEDLLGEAMRSICFSPSFVWRRLRDTQSWGELLRQARAGFKVLFMGGGKK